MFNFFKKKDPQIQSDVVNELNWDPSVDSSKVSVTVKDGNVTLKGSVPHFYEKYNAEQSARRVGGVKAVYDELEIDMLDTYERSDEDIAQAARNSLHWNYQVPSEVTLTVDDGWITLRGTVVWEYERKAAFNAVCSLMGVCGVTNEITLSSSVQPSDVKNRIEEALKRSAETESNNINVSVSGSRVTLSGNVNSYSEIEDATQAAWNAPGVMNVENKLELAA
jgi:osmotically-inducible protein OsmY